MSTCSTHHQVTYSGHLLNRRLKAYSQGLIPRVPRVTGYGKKNAYDLFPTLANGWETIHHVPDLGPPLQAEEDGSPTKEELIPGANCAFTFSPYDRCGQVGSCHLSTHPTSPLDLGQDPSLRLHTSGGFQQWISTTRHKGLGSDIPRRLA
jgi:hypothetical protein